MTRSGGKDAVAVDPLVDLTELLFRQVPPSWFEDGEPSSQAFRPTKKDEGMLSVALASKTTAEAAFRHHTDGLGLKSVGTWAVSVEDVSSVELTAYKDPVDGDPAHGFIDFRDIGRKPSETKAKILKARAHARGCLHRVEQERPGDSVAA